MPRTETPQVRSRATRRDVGDFTSGAAALSRVASALEAFNPAFAVKQAEKQTVDLAAIEQENRDLAIEAERVVRADPKGAAEAMRTGNLSALAPNAEALNRRAFVETFKISVGKSMADEDATAFTSSLQSLDYRDGDPRGAKETFVNEKMQGADPLFEAAYRERFDGIADRSVNQWLSQRSVYMGNRAVETRIGSMERSLRAGEGVSYEDLGNYLADVVNSAVGPAAKAAARERAVYRFMVAAQETGNGGALRALYEKNPETGLSLAEEYPEQAQEAVNKAVSNFRALNSAEAARDAYDIEAALDAAENGLGDKGASDLLLDVLQHEQRYGRSSTLATLRGRVFKLLKDGAVLDAATETLRMAADPNTADPPVDSTTLNKIGQQFALRYTQTRMEEGASEAQVVSELGRIAAVHHGLGTDWNRTVAHQFSNSQDPETNVRAFQLLRAVDGADINNTGAVNAILENETARARYAFVKTAMDFRGMAPQDAFEALNNIDPSTVDNWEKHYSMQLTPSDMDNEVAKTVDDIGDALGVGDASPEVEAVVRRELNRSSAIGNLSAAKDADIVRKATAAALVSNMEVNEKGLLVMRRAPRKITTPDGVERAVAPMTRERQARAVEDWAPVQEVYGDLFGDRMIGVRPDRNFTESGRGYPVIVSSNGLESDITLPYGTYEFTGLPQFNVAIGFGAVQKSQVGEPESGTLTIDETIPETGLAIDPSGAFRFVPHPTKTGYVTLVYTGKALPTAEEVALAREARNTKIIDDLNTHRVADRFEEVVARLVPRDIPTGLPPEEVARIQLEAIEKEIKAARDPEVRARLEEYREILRSDAMPEFVDRVEEGLSRIKDEGVISGQQSATPDVKAEVPGVNEAFVSRIRGALSDLTKKQALPAQVAQNANARMAASETTNIEDLMTAVETETNRSGGTFDSVESDPSRTFMPELESMLEREEGFRSTPYDDGGDKSVGFGFWLGRADAEEMLAKVGATVKGLREGTERLTREQGQNLMRLVNRQNRDFLQRNFPNLALRGHQLAAVMGLMYNDWRKFRSRVMRRALEIGDPAQIKAAFQSIMDDTVHPVLKARRAREIALFEGVGARVSEGANYVSEALSGAYEATADALAGAYNGLADIFSSTDPSRAFEDAKYTFPANARLFVEYLAGRSRPVTRSDLTPQMLKVVRDMAVKAESEGRKQVTYADYPQTRSGFTAADLVYGKSGAREQRYSPDLNGAARLVMDMTDPVLAAATTLGAWSWYRDSEGNLIVTDTYDFSDKSASVEDGSIYQSIRSGLGKADGAIPVKINLGKVR